MEKAIFSITCTTCRARLAVRSQSAIGTILECPKCESMVHIVPPEGWKPAPPPGQELPPTDSTVPPPLDRVSETPLTLELDPTVSSLLGYSWVQLGLAFVVVAVLGWAFWSMLAPRSSPESVARSRTDRPATAAAVDIIEQPSPPPGSQHSGVQSPDNAAKETAASEKPGRPSSPEGSSPTPSTPSIPSSPSTSQPTKPVRADPPSLFPTGRENDEDEDSPPIEVKKSPPAPVDVAARLADPLLGIELTDVPLIGAVDLLASISTAPITLDADSLELLGVAPRDPITLRLGATTIGDALREAAAKRGLTVTVDGGEVIVTAPPEYRVNLRKVRYTVSDLTGDAPNVSRDLAAMIRKLVAPQSWREGGGQGSIESDGDALIVAQTGDVHRQVLVFCEKLRNARRLPLRSREDPRLFTLATRAEQARKMLDRPVTVNFHDPAPLARILAFLSETTGADILVDRAALALADTSDQVEAALTARKQPLGEALTALLRPLGLTFRIVRADLIQVTTREAVEDRLELEFHPIGPWLERGISAERLIEQLKGRVAPDSWNDVGGLAEVYFDAPSGCLIVLQSQPAQSVIERLLATPPKNRAK